MRRKFKVGDVLIEIDPQRNYMEEAVRYTVTAIDGESFSVKRWDNEPGIKIPLDKANRFRRIRL
jgi:hypothetical protein